MRLHVHRWHYPAGGSTLRICRKCARWQTFTGDQATGGSWQYRGPLGTYRLNEGGP